MAKARNIRQGMIQRQTRETKITLTLSLDGHGESRIATGVGFFDHMLTLFARHGLFDLEVEATGDLEVDAHHLVEDVGICLGQALAQAVGDKAGITRYGSALVPMDEALVLASCDLSGRGYLAFDPELAGAPGTAPSGLGKGGFTAELSEEFWRALAINGGVTLHLRKLAGRNLHHILEATFKAVARALREATALDPRGTGVPSTKGIL